MFCSFFGGFSAQSKKSFDFFDKLKPAAGFCGGPISFIFHPLILTALEYADLTSGLKETATTLYL